MSATRFFLPLMLLSIASPAVGQQRRTSLPALPSLESARPVVVLEALRSGGHVLACRHAITHHDTKRSGRFDLNDRTTQRNLSRAGEAQARRLGRALAALGIPIGEVYSSPYARTMETAQLAFDRATADAMLYGGHSPAELRERFNRSPRRGNAVLMTHQGILRSALGYRQPGEGDCVVIRPGDNGPNVVANVTVREWQRLAENHGRRP